VLSSYVLREEVLEALLREEDEMPYFVKKYEKALAKDSRKKLSWRN
jgi:hypothetical protein